MIVPESVLPLLCDWPAREPKMITLMPLFIFFTVGAIAGAVYAYRLITTARKAMQTPGSLYAWPAVPLSSWKFEPEASTAILVHTLAILSLGLFALSAAWNGGILSYPFFANDTTMIALVWFVQYGSILVTGYQLGATLITFPLVIFRRKPVPAAITEKGMTFGRNFLPWSWFSRFAIDGGEGILRLYSAFAPDLPSLTLKLPESIPMEELAEAMQKFLPAHPAGGRAWYQNEDHAAAHDARGLPAVRSGGLAGLQPFTGAGVVRDCCACNPAGLCGRAGLENICVWVG